MQRYIMLNKPKGYITACSDERQATVMDLLPKEERAGLFPVGRLDKDTEGFLILTDDGAFCNAVNSPASLVSKTYRFYARGELRSDTCQRLENGVAISTLKDRLTAPAKIKQISLVKARDASHIFSKKEQAVNRHTDKGDAELIEMLITVTEGKKHQIKKMALAVGLRVVYLERVAISSVSLDASLKRGEYRPLTIDELVKILPQYDY